MLSSGKEFPLREVFRSSPNPPESALILRGEEGGGGRLELRRGHPHRLLHLRRGRQDKLLVDVSAQALQYSIQPHFTGPGPELPAPAAPGRPARWQD